MINEALYVTSRKIVERKFGIRSYKIFREFIISNSYEPFFRRVNQVLQPAGQFRHHGSEGLSKHSVVWKLMKNCNLLAATCKHYGIKQIPTFDDDFKRVDFLEVVEVEV